MARRRSPLRVLAWNIRAGGGTRLGAITDAVAQHDADVLVLSEFRGGDAGKRLREALARLDYRHTTTLTPPPGRNGVLIASRRRFREHGPVDTALPEPYRLLRIETAGVHLTGVYMPNLRHKVPYWQTLIDNLSPPDDGRHAIAIGDFNTCRAFVDEAGAIDATAYFMDRIEAAGFRDLWRWRYPEGREFSWYSTRGNGFRIDHAFLSARLAARAGDIRYSHDERLAGISDHSPLLLDLRV
jgi:exonuclease III